MLSNAQTAHYLVSLIMQFSQKFFIIRLTRLDFFFFLMERENTTRDKEIQAVKIPQV